MITEQAAHIDELVRVAVGQSSARDAIIHQSWVRCVSEHKLDPVVLRDAHIVTSRRLREHRDAMDEFLHTARFGVEMLYRQIAGLGYVLLLTDARGITVDFIGDPTFNNTLRKAGLYLGADWNEPHAGTCAVGTCIATEEALTVHQSDHFDATHIPLTCTAAPVFDPSGKLAAVLDISALRSPEPKASQFLALQLVKSFAHKIENANLLNRFRQEWIIKLSGSAEFADVDPDYVMAVDSSGRIIGFNNRARQLLARELRKRPDLRLRADGFSVSDIFECTIDDLPRFAHSRPTGQRALRLANSGATLFAQTLPPPNKLAAPASSRSESALPAPLRSLFRGDPTMHQVVTHAAKLINTQMGLLITGETGTGKEHLTKALHSVSARAGKPFVAVNCAALPESLIESELFGHEAGAFTGAAAKGKKGLLLEADGGTLFLDEIGDMPISSQTRLLRVLAEREVTPVGRTRPVPLNVRVIAATHRDLVALVKTGQFREDLYFRLNGAVFALPPLRQRTDIEWLIDQSLHRLSTEHKANYALTASARGALLKYQWPGNIRELVNALDHGCALSTDGTIDLADLPDRIAHPLRVEISGKPARGGVATSQQADELLTALRNNRWNVSRVARERGVDRSTIHRQILRFGITMPKDLT
ncbi:sigma-54-dependent Fis family transcriptional regulator (plasmid) [Bradyrhizobium sp. CB82]|uniref:sigma-54-dependent Fis family transcriptional regulator n=1 Tax=Bradyrhizobium sp. CB82 TaxID=3039159 RepID=UPI0024B17931|nr:sigma-54-dependent Fis family transcriptional regulator [Bradyrhizobium sp. CB82]WFU45556.1 sigma-54-dependent Fis family transcriptional regulator [Bradyrhizobium sp. CB82]